MGVKENKSEHNKKMLLQALEKSLGVVTTACRSVGIGRTTFYKYYNTDNEFKKAVDDISNVALDFAESQLHQLMQDKNASSVIFYLKTKGKNRGYYEKSHLDLTTNNEPITIDINLGNEDNTRADD